MTSSSPEARVLDRDAASSLRPARLDRDLRSAPLRADGRADARHVDPALAEVVERAAAEAAARGRAEGFALGYREGRERMVAELEARTAQERADERAAVQAERASLTSLAAALRSTAEALEARCVPAYEHVGEELGGLVCDLVEALLGRELAADRLHVIDAVRRAAAEASRQATLELHLNPADVETLRVAGVDLETLVHRPVVVHADAAVEPGGATADSGCRRIDAQLSGALDRLRDVLSS